MPPLAVSVAVPHAAPPPDTVTAVGIGFTVTETVNADPAQPAVGVTVYVAVTGLVPELIRVPVRLG